MYVDTTLELHQNCVQIFWACMNKKRR